ncbi:hypothetical protein Patl1_04567 [Pistacia atlantica]|uniref:Uncharacterized protein n=1 Tax=Pistacia atlantica TaxID=434234 RepID=A0ACC1BW54_9ROSI|nr:hypothetical protein Patl1_04567 [Pistacia atlantica]
MGKDDKYAEELEVAVRVVHMACSLCQRVQQKLVSDNGGGGHVKSKDDDSPGYCCRMSSSVKVFIGDSSESRVKNNYVKDWSIQATVSLILSETFGSENVSIVAEEDVQTLSKADSEGLLAAVVKAVNECLAEAPKYGLRIPDGALGTSQILEAISRCNSSGGPTGRHWVLDPVDGTLGFVRGDQYAIALALIEDGKVVLGVLGCPNYPLKKEKGAGEAWMQPLIHGNKKLEWPNSARQIRVSPCVDPALATVCEPVERANTDQVLYSRSRSDHGALDAFTYCSRRTEPMRVHSMVKYAAIACGDVEIFMKFARSGYKEKIWDHAAAVNIIEEAGGVVTDAGGLSLDFSRGLYLEGLDRGIVACCGARLHKKIIAAVYASWEASNL